MTNISREACQQARVMLCINGLPETARLVTALRDALDRERERCAAVAETVTERHHIAHDICSGDFPKRSDMRDFIAAAIRAGGAA